MPWLIRCAMLLASLTLAACAGSQIVFMAHPIWTQTESYYTVQEDGSRLTRIADGADSTFCGITSDRSRAVIAYKTDNATLIKTANLDGSGEQLITSIAVQDYCVAVTSGDVVVLQTIVPLPPPGGHYRTLSWFALASPALRVKARDDSGLMNEVYFASHQGEIVWGLLAGFDSTSPLTYLHEASSSSGSPPRTLTGPGSVFLGTAQWAVDIFQRDLGLYAAPLDGGLAWWLSLDYNEATASTFPGPITTLGAEYCGHTYGPNYNNGELSEIAYTRRYRAEDWQGIGYGGEMFAVRVDSTNFRPLLHTPATYDDRCVGVASDDWLVFERTNAGGTKRLFSLRMDGSQETHPLSSGDDDGFEGSTLAQRILFTTRDSLGSWSLHAVNVDGSGDTLILAGNASVYGTTSQNRAIVYSQDEGWLSIDVFDARKTALAPNLLNALPLAILCAPSLLPTHASCGVTWRAAQPAYIDF